jgi:membrane protein
MLRGIFTKSFWRRARAYGYRALWEVDERSLPRWRRIVVNVVRLAFVTFDGFFRERLQIRAAALAFFTVLSIIPFAALTFSIAKSVGYYDFLIKNTVRPALIDTFKTTPGESVPEGVLALRDLLDAVLALVAHTDVFGLGAVGFGLLLLTISRVVRGAEESFDTIWSSKTTQPFYLRLPGYIVVSTITPASLVIASTLTAARHTEVIERFIPIPFFHDLVSFVLPPALVCIGIWPMYVLLTSVRVRRRSAWIGALVGGLGWYALQVLHVKFQIGVARQNALYSGFGAFPLFLVWLHLSWVWILLGAQVAAAHQNAPTLRQLARLSLDDHASRQAVGLRAMIQLCDHPEGARLRALAETLGVAVTPLKSVLDALVAHGLLASRGGPYDPEYTTNVDPELLRVAAVIEALGKKRSSLTSLPWDDADRPLTEVLEGIQRAVESSDHNRTIGELRRATDRARRAGDPSS